MEKIMFNDFFGLTDAVLAKQKTMTRRSSKSLQEDIAALAEGFRVDSLSPEAIEEEMQKPKFKQKVKAMEPALIQMNAKYKVGEVVAIAQSYLQVHNTNPELIPDWLPSKKSKSGFVHWDEHPGYSNKMFVSADLMPHQIRITGIKVERLQDISEEDCRKEGIIHVNWRQYLKQDIDDFGPQRYRDHDLWTLPIFEESLQNAWAEQKPGEFAANDPKTALIVLFAKLAHRQPTAFAHENPWVLAYDFELVK